MKTTIFILTIVPPALENGKSGEMNGAGWYIAGAFIALLLIAYLVYSLTKPEKF